MALRTSLRIVQSMARRGGPAVGQRKKGVAEDIHYRPSGPPEGVGQYGDGAGDGDDGARRGADEG